jgi:hypothetical protein
MAEVSSESWRSLPERAGTFARLSAHPIDGLPGSFLAVDHDGGRHLLIEVAAGAPEVRDERSRGIRAMTRPLAVADEEERPFIDVVSTNVGGHDVFNVVASSVLDAVRAGGDPAEAVSTTLSRWRRFWGSVPPSGLTPEQLSGLFGELWFLAVWLLPHGLDGLRHWMGPLGARHDFQWPKLAIEVKATASIHGHFHRINGIDQLEIPLEGVLQLFSLRLREEATASNSVVSLISRIETVLASEPAMLDEFETRLSQAGYSPLDRERYAEMRYRVINERLYSVADGFPRLTPASFPTGVPVGVERIEYEINLDACPQLLLHDSPDDFHPPA